MLGELNDEEGDEYFKLLDTQPPSSVAPPVPATQRQHAIPASVGMAADASVYFTQRVDLAYIKAMKTQLRCARLAELKIAPELFGPIFDIFGKQLHVVPPGSQLSLFCPGLPPLTPQPPVPPCPPAAPARPAIAKRPANAPAKVPAKRFHAASAPPSPGENKTEWMVNVYHSVVLRFPGALRYDAVTVNPRRLAFNTATEIDDLDAGFVHLDMEIAGMRSETGCCETCLTKYRKMWADRNNAMEKTVLMCRKIERVDERTVCFEMKFLCSPAHHHLTCYEVAFMAACVDKDAPTRPDKMEARLRIDVQPFRVAEKREPETREVIALLPVEQFSVPVYS